MTDSMLINLNVLFFGLINITVITIRVINIAIDPLKIWVRKFLGFFFKIYNCEGQLGGFFFKNYNKEGNFSPSLKHILFT